MALTREEQEELDSLNEKLSTPDFYSAMDSLYADEEEDKETGFLSNVLRGSGERLADLGGNLMGAAEDAREGLSDWMGGDLRVGYNLRGEDSGFDLGFFTPEEIKKQGTVFKAADKALNEVDLGYEERYTLERMKEDPGFMTVAGFGVETLGKSLADIAGMYASLPLYFTSREREMAKERSEADGRGGETTFDDYVKVAPGNAISTLLDKWAFRKAISTKAGEELVTKIAGGSIAKEVTKRVAREAATEGLVQEPAEYLSTHLGTEKGVKSDELKDVVLGGVVGGAFGGGILGGPAAMMEKKNAQNRVAEKADLIIEKNQAELDAILAGEDIKVVQGEVIEPESDPLVEENQAELDANNAELDAILDVDADIASRGFKKTVDPLTGRPIYTMDKTSSAKADPIEGTAQEIPSVEPVVEPQVEAAIDPETGSVTYTKDGVPLDEAVEPATSTVRPEPTDKILAAAETYLVDQTDANKTAFDAAMNEEILASEKLVVETPVVENTPVQEDVEKEVEAPLQAKVEKAEDVVRGLEEEAHKTKLAQKLESAQAKATTATDEFIETPTPENKAKALEEVNKLSVVEADTKLEQAKVAEKEIKVEHDKVVAEREASRLPDNEFVKVQYGKQRPDGMVLSYDVEKDTYQVQRFDRKGNDKGVPVEVLSSAVQSQKALEKTGVPKQETVNVEQGKAEASIEQAFRPIESPIAQEEVTGIIQESKEPLSENTLDDGIAQVEIPVAEVTDPYDAMVESYGELEYEPDSRIFTDEFGDEVELNRKEKIVFFDAHPKVERPGRANRKVKPTKNLADIKTQKFEDVMDEDGDVANIELNAEEVFSDLNSRQEKANEMRICIS